MSRRLPVAITLALVGVLAVLFTGITYGFNFYRASRERQLEEWLGGIAQTFGQFLDPIVLAQLAITYEARALDAPIADGTAPVEGGDSLLEPAAATKLSEALNGALEELRAVHELRSVSLITESAVTLAAAGAREEIGERSVLYEIDRPQIEAAISTGRPAATGLYELDGSQHKRLYDALPAHIVEQAMNPAEEAAGETAPPAGHILLRIEARADYLKELAQLKVLRRRIMFVEGLLVAVLGAAFYLLVRRLQVSTERLAREDRFRSLGRLAAGLAHELRNPLGILRFSVEEVAWSAKEDGDDRIAPLARDMIEEIDRMNRLIGNILSFGQQGDLDANGSSKLWEVLPSPLRWLEKSAPNNWRLLLPIAPEVGTEGADLEIAMSGDAFRQIVLNLLRNAVEALEGQEKPRPTIHVGVVAREASIELSVEDNGPGISRRAARRIFEPFYTDKAQGTGLGLPLSRRLAESVDGALIYAPASERGARFVLTVPTR